MLPPHAHAARFVALLVVSACASPTPPKPAATAPLVSPVASAEPDGALREAPSDPSVVRCGIDDRPRAILGAGDRVFVDASRAKRAMVADSAPPPPQVPVPAGSAAALPLPIPRATAKLAAPRLEAGGPASSVLAAAFAASSIDLDGCEALATPEDEGGYDLHVSMASGGATLVVKSAAPSKPTAYVRCVMERACRLRGDESAPAGAVVVPIAVTWNFPKARGKPPTQLGAQAPRVFFEARDDANASKHGFFRTMRQLVRQDARACMGPVEGAEMRVTLALSKGKPPRVAGAKVEELAPGVPAGIPECVVDRLKNRPLPDRPDGVTDGEIALIVAW